MIYLDNAATTKVSPFFINDVKFILSAHWENASSNSTKGREVRQLVEDARLRAANAIGANSNQIIFTSGGSESNALALNGWKSIYASSVEHH